MFLDVLECVETFFLRGGRSPLGRPKASGGRRPPQEQEARRASMFLYIYIYYKQTREILKSLTPEECGP